MRRMIRNFEGEPKPLIMHPRFAWLRDLDGYVRFRICRKMGIMTRMPRYQTIRRTPEQEARLMLTIEGFVGMRSPEPKMARYFKERLRMVQLTDTIKSDKALQALVDEGPRCTPEDRAYALSRAEHEECYMMTREGQVGLARIEADAQSIIKRFATSLANPLATRS